MFFWAARNWLSTDRAPSGGGFLRLAFVTFAGRSFGRGPVGDVPDVRRRAVERDVGVQGVDVDRPKPGTFLTGPNLPLECCQIAARRHGSGITRGPEVVAVAGDPEQAAEALVEVEAACR